MKKKIKLIIVCTLMCLCAVVGIFFSTTIVTKNVAEASTIDQDFLNFEQAVIDLNNKQESPSQKFSSPADVNEEEEINENSEFVLKRLIVTGSLKNTYSAYSVVSYNDIHILSYKTIAQTEYAYNQLLQDSNLTVMIDSVCEIQGYADNDYSYSEYKTWGAEAMDIGGYREYLQDNNVNKEVVVVVLDTGINTAHEQFKNRLLTDSEGKIKGFSYFDSLYQYSYSNLAFDSNDTEKNSFEDDDGHGTHVAGTICDLTPSNVKILPIKIGNGNDENRSSNSIMISAYLRVLNIYSKQYNIVATNLSFSGGGKSSEEQRDTFNSQCLIPLKQKNIITVTAAGNESVRKDIEGLESIVVSNVQQNGNTYSLATSSNYGVSLELAAPGTSIYAACIGATDAKHPSAYAYKTGTSMASPHVAAAVALLALDPLYAEDSAEQLEQRLYNLALDIGAEGKDVYFGYGLVNIKYFNVNSGEAEILFFDGPKEIDINKTYVYEDEILLTVECSLPGYKIFYTTDQSIPSKYSEEFPKEAITNPEKRYSCVAFLFDNLNNIIAKTEIYQLSISLGYYDVNDSGTLLSCYDESENIIIPEFINGIQIITIGASVFEGNANLRSVQLPESVTSISKKSFAFCNNLTTINLNNIYSIGARAFNNCSSLTTVDLDNAVFINEYAFGKNSMIQKIDAPNLTYLGKGAFELCNSLTEMNAPKLITLGAYAFNRCEGLIEAKFNNVKQVGDYAFYSASVLTRVYLKNVVSIGSYSFQSNNISDLMVGIKFASAKYNKLSTTTKVYGYAGTYAEQFATNAKAQYVEINSLQIVEDLPATKLVLKNESADLTLNVLGHELKYEWYVCDNEELLNPTKIEVPEDTSKYTVVGDVNGSHYYYAIVTDWEGYSLQTSTCKVTVVNSYTKYPIVITQHGNGTVLPGYEFTVYSGEPLTIRFVPDEGWDIYSININDTYYSMWQNPELFADIVLNGYTINSVDMPYNISCDFGWDIFFGEIKEYDGGYLIVDPNWDNMPDEFYDILWEYPELDVFEVLKDLKEFETYYGENLPFMIKPNEGYYINKILVNNEVYDILFDPLGVNKFTLNNITQGFSITAEFLPIQTTYTVNHYVEKFDSENYELKETELLNGDMFSSTKATEKQFEGFTCKQINQQVLSPNQNVIIDVYYTRNSYQITLNYDNGIEGVIGAGNYLYGQNITISAQLYDGYEFAGWKQDQRVFAQNQTCIFTMPAQNLSLEAATNLKTYSINLVQTEHGAIVGQSVAQYNENITIQFVPESGYHIDCIEVNGVKFSNNETYTILGIKENYTITAFFAVNTYSISVIQANNGVISPETLENIAEGTDCTFTFVPDAGYYLQTIIVDGNAIPYGEIENIIKDSYTFNNIDKNHTLSANFVLNKYTITISNSIGGTINYNGKIEVNYGEQKEFEFIPSPGYKIERVYVDDENVGNVNSYIFNNINSDHQLYVEFSKLNYIVTAAAGINGTITPAGSTMVDYGEGLIYNFSPNTGYYISDVKVNNVSVGAVNSYTFLNITENKVISVEFEKQEYTIEIICDNNGVVEYDGSLNVKYGESKIFNIIPNENYSIYSVELNGEKIDTKNLVEINNITKNQTLKVAFKLVNFLIEASSGGNGTITQTASVNLGEQKRFDFYPNEGYKVSDVKIDNVSVGAVEYYVFVGVTESHTIHVEYEIQKFNIVLSVAGEGTATPNKLIKDVAYGDSRVIDIAAKTGWKLLSVYIDGESVEIENNQLALDNIRKDVNIQIVFEEMVTTPNNNGMIFIIIIGILTLSTLFMLFLYFKQKSKSLKLIASKQEQQASVENVKKQQNKINNIKQDKQANVNLKLQKALEFAKENQNNFKAFCERCKIDYKNNYNDAVIRYYDAYLRFKESENNNKS